MKKIFFLLLIFIFIISCNDSMYKEKLVAPVKKVKDTIIAEVNGIPITLSDYKREEKNLPNQLKKLLKEKDKKKQFIENLITKELLYQEAKKANIDKMKLVREMIRNYKKNIMINELIQLKVKNQVNISDDEAYKYYIENKKDFYSADKIAFTKYFFKDYSDAVNFLKNHDLSQCYNKCYSESDNLTTIDNLPQNIVLELEKLKSGEYGKNILFSSNGYMILQLNKRIKGNLQPFYTVKNIIKSTLKQVKEKTYLSQYISAIKSQSKIKIYWDKLKKTGD